jgi:hypothetical protein
MPKESCLFAVCAMLFFVPSCTQNNRIDAIQSNLSHIEQAIKDITSEKEMVASINKSSKQQIKNGSIGHMMDSWAHKLQKDKIKSTLAPIISSNEFIKTINYLTDFQVACIVNQQIHYDDIIYTPASYPAEQKILTQKTDQAFAETFPISNETTELLFNIYYLQATQDLGYKLLLEKLNIKKNDLLTQLAALEATN